MKDNYDKLADEVESLIAKKFPSTKTDSSYYRAIVLDLARTLTKKNK